ncbi:unnamed protein product [Penicillium nalgiovense]|uniref:Uncharacterized protein n=1 Tax=Penicillium nalgiovense TaxID=60175 RepID=A0A9W4INM2_PENNA|nr:unnamed protein product [Penicillium nalgiovense]CAG7948545.1 unnamed protein product [Penicillium nalgiovense]CAG7998153.1 unnamed protein product [Penicillium nalgiovense]CAG8024540.1 unnamed protein product [Penicillium nalgiovense]CAG8042855.1 unnamed protein product [Penicillium nalgiovense]
MSPVQQYWLPGYGLSRHIVLGHIQYFLGPSATVRPYSYQEQIDDLAVMSREYEKQEATRMAHNSSSGSTSSSSSDNSVTQSEPYINEIIPISQPGARRREPDSRGGR